MERKRQQSRDIARELLAFFSSNGRLKDRSPQRSNSRKGAREMVTDEHIQCKYCLQYIVWAINMGFSGI
jgi:hypothetical protein